MTRTMIIAMVSSLVGLGCARAPDVQADTQASPTLEDSTLVMPVSARGGGSVAVVTVSPPAGADSIAFGGRLVWSEDATVRIFTPFAGRVTRVLSDIGQRVRPGQTLAVIEAPDFGQALADARRAMADLNLATRTVARQRDLLAHGVASRREVEAAETDSIRAASDRQRTEARLALYGAESTASAQGFPLRAPLGGLVVERNLTPGQEVRPDQMLAGTAQLTAPLFLITDPGHLWVQVDIPEQDAGRVAPGQPMSLRVLALPGRAFKGRLTVIASEIDPTTRTIKARGVVDNPSQALKAEMLVSVQVGVPTGSALTVPAQSVFLEGADRFVFVQDGAGRYRHRSVTTGAARNGVVSVIKGLNVGDRIVVDGVLLLNQLYHSLTPAVAKSS